MVGGPHSAYFFPVTALTMAACMSCSMSEYRV
jgi:hypothetical protein